MVEMGEIKDSVAVRTKPLCGLRLLMDGHFPNKVTIRRAVKYLLAMPTQLGMTRLQYPVVMENDESLDGFVVIAESHVALHIHKPADVNGLAGESARYGTVDISTCRPDRLDIRKAMQFTSDSLGFVLVKHYVIPWSVGEDAQDMEPIAYG